jgi:hypothetical protein
MISSRYRTMHSSPLLSLSILLGLKAHQIYLGQWLTRCAWLLTFLGSQLLFNRENRKGKKQKRDSIEMIEIAIDTMKFLILMVDPGLKAHQTPCVWASGSLDINSKSDLVFNWSFLKIKRREWMKRGGIWNRNDKNQRAVVKRSPLSK